MISLEKILRAQGAAHPLMRPCDGVKLLYQNEFGGGHLIKNPEIALERLRTEHNEAEHDSTAPLYEDIGNGMVRVFLTALDTERYSLKDLNSDFVDSANSHRGTLPSFLEKLELLKCLTTEGIFGFTSAELEAYLRAYAAEGYPAVSHSPEYRAAYRPAYRIVRWELIRQRFLPRLSENAVRLLAAAEKLGKDNAVIALDGRCASGKSTLAEELRYLGVGLIHMDDFFLRPEQRSAERLTSPGENVDHERFFGEVMEPLNKGEGFTYRPYDCGTQTLSAPVTYIPAELNLIEGSYSCHPSLWEYYDLRAFLTIAPETQMARIIKRDGADYSLVFRDKWIPLEEAYISAFDIERRAELLLKA